MILNAGAAWQNPAAALGPVPHLGPQDSYLPIQNGAGPTIPARWDDNQRYSNAYSDSDTHNYATDYFDTTSPSHAGAARPTPPSVNSTA